MQSGEANFQTRCPCHVNHPKASKQLGEPRCFNAITSVSCTPLACWRGVCTNLQVFPSFVSSDADICVIESKYSALDMSRFCEAIDSLSSAGWGTLSHVATETRNERNFKHTVSCMTCGVVSNVMGAKVFLLL